MSRGVVDHALEIDDDRGLVADHPSVVPRRQQRHITRAAVKLGAVVHANPQYAGDGATNRPGARTAGADCARMRGAALAGRGKTDRDIAQILAISVRAVHKHTQRIYTKRGVETRTAAVMRALQAR